MTRLKIRINAFFLNKKQPLTHLFVSCSHVKDSGLNSHYWWNTEHDGCIVLNKKKIIYGFTNNFALLEAWIEPLLMIAKYYIYTTAIKRRRLLLL